MTAHDVAAWAEFADKVFGGAAVATGFAATANAWVLLVEIKR